MSGRVRYPSDCPVFEVVGVAYRIAGPRAGEVVEGIGFHDDYEWIMVRNPDGDNLIDGTPTGNHGMSCCGDGWEFNTADLRPLTRAAREQLAHVRRG